MSMYECPKCGGLPGVTACCSDQAKGLVIGAQPAITSETGNTPAQGASAITSGPLYQALTDPENQPNQYGVEFLLRGPKFAFKVGAQQFTLDYEPTEPGEFEFMRDMLIHAFSTFTPDVKTAQAVPLLTDEEMRCCTQSPFTWDNYRAIESLVRSKLGAGVPMTPAELDKAMQAMFYPARNRAFMDGVRAAERHHGIVGKEGGNV